MNPYSDQDPALVSTSSPFAPGNNGAYKHWRQHKLGNYPLDTAALRVPVQDLNNLSPREKTQILRLVGQTNMCLYQALDQSQWNSKEAVLNLSRQLGLQHLDQNLCADEEGLSAITVADKGRGQDYIPYTNKPINWHTDGYYNTEYRRIRGMALHCVCPAAQGGENSLLDPEIVYILLRDENPEHISALMASNAMTIPANKENGVLIRPPQTGPVFSIDALTGKLHMRYTHRTRSIEWRQDSATQAAVSALRGLLDGATDYHVVHRLQAGEGVICNNVLHTRSGFTDDPAHGCTRLIYRARYHDRITDLPTQ